MRSAWFDTCSLDDLTFQQELQIAGLVDGISLVESTIEEEARRLCGKAENIVLGGFSQGCATALWALLVGAAMTKGRIGAFVGLSAWMPFMKEVKESVEVDLREEHSETVIQRLRHDIPEVLRIQPRVSRDFMQDCFKIPIYLGHGADVRILGCISHYRTDLSFVLKDTLISIENCYQISSILTAVGATVSVREYVGAKRNGHWVKEPEQTDDIIRFLSKVLGTSDMPAVS